MKIVTFVLQNGADRQKKKKIKSVSISAHCHSEVHVCFFVLFKVGSVYRGLNQVGSIPHGLSPPGLNPPGLNPPSLIPPVTSGTYGFCSWNYKVSLKIRSKSNIFILKNKNFEHPKQVFVLKMACTSKLVSVLMHNALKVSKVCRFIVFGSQPKLQNPYFRMLFTRSLYNFQVFKRPSYLIFQCFLCLTLDSQQYGGSACSKTCHGPMGMGAKGHMCSLKNFF